MKNLLLIALLSCASVSANEVTAEVPAAPVENRTEVSAPAEEETTAPAPVEAHSAD